MLEKQMSYKEAARYKMPFGKYKGRTLRQISKGQRGRDWLAWFSQQEIRSHYLRMAMEIFLAGPPAEG